MTLRECVPPLRGDETELFRRHHRHRLRLVPATCTPAPSSSRTRAYAWIEFVAGQPERTNPLGWLRVVCGPEAIRLARHDRSAAHHTADGAEPVATADPPVDRARHALELIAAFRRASAPS